MEPFQIDLREVAPTGFKNQSQDNKNRMMLAVLEQVINGVEQCRPGDRSELDRAYSIIRTEAEKNLGFFMLKAQVLP